MSAIMRGTSRSESESEPDRVKIFEHLGLVFGLVGAWHSSSVLGGVSLL